MMRILRHGLVMCAAMTIGGCVSPAIDDEPVARLNYRDLDLADAGSRHLLRLRVHAAARDFCEHRARRRKLPPHYVSANPAACLLPAERALIDAAPPAVRRAWVPRGVATS